MIKLSGKVDKSNTYNRFSTYFLSSCQIQQNLQFSTYIYIYPCYQHDMMIMMIYIYIYIYIYMEAFVV